MSHAKRVRNLLLGPISVKRDKYFRLVANIATPQGDLAEMLLSRNLAVEYDGGGVIMVAGSSVMEALHLSLRQSALVVEEDLRDAHPG